MTLPTTPDGKVIIPGYYPSIPAAIAGMALFGAVAVAFLWNFFRYGRQRYLLWVTVGAIMMALGMAVRIPVHNDPTSIPTYSVSTLLTLLSPCAFIAQDYYVLPKLAEWADADDCLFLQPRLVGRIFLISDAVTFFLQMSGSGMGAVASMASIGDKIALIGLIAQLVSFSVFIVLLVWFGFQVYVHGPQTRADSSKRHYLTKWNAQVGKGWKRDWRAVYWATLWTCLGLMVRCVFRVIEFSQGYDGQLRTTEWYFYVFDSLPLILAISVWVFIWPEKYFKEKLSQDAYALATSMYP
ncbi:uncharacterized protein EHS24_003955 [Apiotrichum porosum]|uniref:Uncharacterized protein n=1 Tax=Apiotrichum porosum TaxID=105984 RepID=A0A427XE74_9TREE|nr:uncharacterized protein EHS24_003955 [Apiotrichum porosum]RSH77014.1 hypothetical protein EHS24_003955 [Apiotrichum porosum]